MKKVIAFILCTVMITATFTACGSQTVGNATDIQVDESLLLDSNVLTDYLCRSLNNKSQPEDGQFNYLPFVFSCYFYKDQPEFCYYDETPVDPYTEQLTIDIAGCDKIIHQVFDDSWDITQNLAGYAADVTDTAVLFPTALDWGLMGYYAGDYIYSEFNDDKTRVVSHFELFGPDWDGDDIAHKSYGDYQIIFDIVTENNETFLRFNRFEKE